MIRRANPARWCPSAMKILPDASSQKITVPAFTASHSMTPCKRSVTPYSSPPSLNWKRLASMVTSLAGIENTVLSRLSVAAAIASGVGGSVGSSEIAGARFTSTAVLPSSRRAECSTSASVRISGVSTNGLSASISSSASAMSDRISDCSFVRLDPRSASMPFFAWSVVRRTASRPPRNATGRTAPPAAPYPTLRRKSWYV